ncbi:MAG: archease [Nanoarchaeota archaeon]|nr:archease [Nanoarchaeota archaeon]MCG2717815.1 archease [Nanoarchaeota archaeon]
MKYKFLEHTADTKFQAFGKTLEESFSNAAIAMFEVLLETKKVKKKITKKIKVEAQDKEGLLYKWLEELLFLLDTDFFVIHNVKNMEIKQKGKKYLLVAEVEGDTYKDEYGMHGSVKAVTYNEMFVKEEEGKATVQVVLDI